MTIVRDHAFGAADAGLLRYSAFGLDVEDHIGLAGARAGGSATGRSVTLRSVASRPRALQQTHVVATQLREDGRLELAIGTDRAGDFWFDSPGAGRFRLRGDGRLIEAACAAGADSGVLCNRMMLGHALPFAALVHGLEVLHVAAVVLPAEAVAIHGDAGPGKTAVALELVAHHGGRMLTDDRLAVEPGDTGVLGYPGIGTASLSRLEASRLGDSALATVGRVLAEDRWSMQLQLATPERSPAQLGALYRLRPRAGAGTVEVRCVASPDPRLILATTIDSGTRTPARALAQRALCARAARTMRICEVLVPDHATPAETAAAIEADAATLVPVVAEVDRRGAR